MTVILDVLSIFWQLKGSSKIKLSILGFLLKHTQEEKLWDANKISGELGTRRGFWPDNENLKQQERNGAPTHIITEFAQLLQFHIATYFDNELPGQPRETQRSR